MTLQAPFDLWYWLVNTLSGTTTIFLFVSAIMIAVMAMRFRMPNVIFAVIILLFAILIRQWIFWPYLLGVIIFLLIIGYQIYKMAAR